MSVNVSSTCGIMISSKDERKDDFQFFNFLKKYIQNLEGTAWQQAVLLLHNVGFWDIMEIGFVYTEEE